MRLKKDKQSSDDQVKARCKTSEKNSIQRKANLYTDGNLSEWIIYASINYVPSKSELEKGKK
jgi:hypothetical protein